MWNSLFKPIFPGPRIFGIEIKPIADAVNHIPEHNNTTLVSITRLCYLLRLSSTDVNSTQNKATHARIFLNMYRPGSNGEPGLNVFKLLCDVHALYKYANHSLLKSTRQPVFIMYTLSYSALRFNPANSSPSFS